MNTQDVNTLHETLSAHYPVAFAQEITDNVTRLHRQETQFLDIKELNDLAAEYRARLRALAAECRALRRQARTNEGQTTHIRQLYASHEALFIQRQVSDLWKVYRIVMADSAEMTADYLARLARRTYKVSPSSPPTRKTSRAAT